MITSGHAYQLPVIKLRGSLDGEDIWQPSDEVLRACEISKIPDNSYVLRKHSF